MKYKDTILKKIWHLSPSKLYYFFFKKKIKQNENILIEEIPKWIKVIDGPGKDIYLYLNPNNSIWEKMQNGDYDIFLFNAIKKFVKKNSVIWDIGAHFGYNSLVFAKILGESGKVVAFEPNVANLRRFEIHLSKNSELESRIQLNSIAISDSDGESLFNISENVEDTTSTGSFLSDILPPEKKEIYQQYNFKSVKVRTAQIDTLVYAEKFPRPDFIKIDVEGAEFQVLKGARKFLMLNSPVLLIEIHNVLAMYDVLSFLLDQNYQVEILDRENASLSRSFILANKK